MPACVCKSRRGPLQQPSKGISEIQQVRMEEKEAEEGKEEDRQTSKISEDGGGDRWREEEQ